MLVCGKNVVKEILKTNGKIKKIMMAKDFYDSNINQFLDKSKITYKSQKELDDILDKNQGIIMEIADFEYCDLSDIIRDSELPFLVMLDHIEDPHNFGAIIRTCEAAGVDGIIIPKDRSVSVNSTVMKTSSGALTGVKIAAVNNLADTIKKLKENGYWVIGMDMNGQDYDSIDYNMPVCLVVGNEGKGLKQLTRKKCDIIASIPMKGNINSLNASVATGIMIYGVINKRK